MLASALSSDWWLDRRSRHHFCKCGCKGRHYFRHCQMFLRFFRFFVQFFAKAQPLHASFTSVSARYTRYPAYPTAIARMATTIQYCHITIYYSSPSKRLPISAISSSSNHLERRFLACSTISGSMPVHTFLST